MGKPDVNHIGSIFNYKYDVIIDLTEDIVVPLAYIMAMVEYNFACGVKKDNFNFYDFVLDFTSQRVSMEVKDPDDINESHFSVIILEQIVKYLKMVKSK